MARIAAATVPGDIVFYAWGMLPRMVLSWHNAAPHAFSDQEAAVTTIQARARKTPGLYTHPAWSDFMTMPPRHVSVAGRTQ